MVADSISYTKPTAPSGTALKFGQPINRKPS
jgi:hypothetical protein